MLLHDDRYYPTTTLTKRGVVVHDSESGDGSSSNLINVLRRPGDKPSSNGGFYGAGYHAVTDGVGGYVQMADASAATYSAPPLNPTWWHICMPGRAIQTREEWLDQLSYAHICGVAKFIVDKWKEDGQTWSLSFLFSDMLKLGMRGYTSHYQVSLAWKQTNHYDPGHSFPWDILEKEIGKLINPIQEDDEMTNIRFVRHNGYINVFMVGAGPAISIAEEVMKSYPTDTPRVFIKENIPFLRSLCFQSGLDMNDEKQLVPGGPDDRF